jgi:hypothetical protein
MAKRRKIYYPESEIVRSQFTNGYYLMDLETWENYIGAYHYYESTGEVFSEADWHPTKSRKLIPYRPGKDRSYFRYVDLTHYKRINGQKEEIVGPIKLHKFRPPIQYPIRPSEVEKKNGLMTRYFLIKRNEIHTRLPIEIDAEQASTYTVNGGGINHHLYELIEMPWKLNGPEYDVVENNILKQPGVIDTNRRIVLKFSQKFPILAKIVTNFIQFSIYDK